MKNRLFIIGLLIIAGLVFVIGVVGYVAYKWHDNSPGRQFNRAYGHLELGMDEDDVHNLYGKPPDFFCYYREYRICYYLSSGMFAGSLEDVEIEQGATVEMLEELPYFHAAVQVAFDGSGHLHAYTWNGETYTVETFRGAVSGARFAQLDDSYFPTAAAQQHTSESGIHAESP